MSIIKRVQHKPDSAHVMSFKKGVGILFGWKMKKNPTRSLYTRAVTIFRKKKKEKKGNNEK